MNYDYDRYFNKNKLIKWLMSHRLRVSNKMSVLGNDLVIRGRRHDNSYSDDMEVELATRSKTSDILAERKRYAEMLENLHKAHNDYCPLYFENGLLDMNLVQIMELICDSMARYEETKTSDGNRVISINPEDYYDYVLAVFPEDIPELLQSLVKNTIDYIVDKNSVIKKMIEKREAIYSGETKKE